MSATNLHWIDDSFKHMFPIVDNVFPLLWDEDISCTSILFGNAYCVKADEHGPNQEDCKELNNYIEAKFILYCQDLDRYYWREGGETFEKKKHLLFNPAAKIISLEHTAEGAVGNELRKLVNKWMDQENLAAFQAALATIPVKEALDEFGLSVGTLISVMDIPDKSPIALDIFLLHGDGVRAQKRLPTLSMALYSALSLDHPCYLYSDMAVSQERADQWKQLYNTIFPAHDFDIYPKTGLATKEIGTKAKRHLVKIMKKQERDQNEDV